MAMTSPSCRAAKAVAKSPPRVMPTPPDSFAGESLRVGGCSYGKHMGFLSEKTWETRQLDGEQWSYLKQFWNTVYPNW